MGNVPQNAWGKDADIFSWLRLIRSEKVGPVTFWQLINRYGTASNALKALSGHTIHKNNLKYQLACEKDVEKEIASHKASGLVLLPAFDNAFPKMLHPLPDCPPVISVYGCLSILNEPVLAMVGARNASLPSRQFSQSLASELGKAGWKIASGLARGIDCFAHQGALSCGTIAVVAGGVDVIYPPEHEKLYHEIARTGAIISEMPLSMFPGAGHFPRRNRLISGLSQGVVIVEAALKSGSLITARMTLEQGRELFAVPGSPLDPRCRGTNGLLRQGATLVESAEDVLSVMNSHFGFQTLKEPASQIVPAQLSNQKIDWDDLEKNILQDLSLVPISIDTLVQRYQVAPQTILTLMLEWELQGRIQRYSGNRVALSAS